MDVNKKRKYTATADHGNNCWPLKAIPSLDSTLKLYSFPYGPYALLEERSTVRQLLEVAHSIRMPELKWVGLSGFCSSNGVGLLGMRLSVDEAFVDSETKRNALVDRAHDHFNTTWKLEVQAMTKNANENNNQDARQTTAFVFYERTEEHLYATIDKIDKMRGLYESLKQETVDLMRRCRTTNEIRRAMVFPMEASTFLNM
jgi:hypothetical protein